MHPKPRFEELDYRETDLGELILRRRTILALDDRDMGRRPPHELAQPRVELTGEFGEVVRSAIDRERLVDADVERHQGVAQELVVLAGGDDVGRPTGCLGQHADDGDANDWET